MASSLYARYVPPKNLPSQADANISHTSKKRKRNTKIETSAKELDESVRNANHEIAKANSEPSESSALLKKKNEVTTRHDGLDNPLQMPSGESSESYDPDSSASVKTQAREKKNNSKESNHGENKHIKVMSKFERATKGAAKVEHQDHEVKGFDAEHEDIPVGETASFPEPKPRQDENEAAQSFSALPSWLTSPQNIIAENGMTFERLGLDGKLLQNLTRHGLVDALPVQAGVLPLLLPSSTLHQGDLCISAATGSGKTLTYVLPVISSILGRVTTKLRAIIVLPTRDLAKQVSGVFEKYTAGTGLKVQCCHGGRPLQSDGDSLVNSGRRYDPKERDRQDLATNDEEDDSDMVDLNSSLSPGYVRHYTSKTDILVCTPGRLVDLIKFKTGFSLNEVSWFIIDEVDRLLDESFQDWTQTVTKLLQRPPLFPALSPLSTFNDALFLQPILRQPVRKVLLSASMSTDLQELARLDLFNVLHVTSNNLQGSSNAEYNEVTDDQTTGQTLVVPDTLEEFVVPVDDVSKKPLYLIRLLKHILKVVGTSVDDNGMLTQKHHPGGAIRKPHENSPRITFTSFFQLEAHNPPRALIFTSTRESASRLQALLTQLIILLPVPPRNFPVHIVTDGFSRGIDIDTVAHVINYDVPRSTTSYVHRVGRTARAGRKGIAWTLVETKEAGWFWNVVAKDTSEIQRADRKVKREKLGLVGLTEHDIEIFEKALDTLRHKLTNE